MRDEAHFGGRRGAELGERQRGSAPDLAGGYTVESSRYVLSTSSYK